MKKAMLLSAFLFVGDFFVQADAPPTAPKPTKEPTVIHSERGEFDSQNHVATLEGHVVVVDPALQVNAQKMIVFFDTENKVSRIEASGEVIIQQQDKTTHSDHAVYTPTDGKVVLTGNPSVENPQGTVRGQTITFYRDERKIFVEKAILTIKSSGTGFPELFPKKPDEPSPGSKPATKP